MILLFWWRLPKVAREPAAFDAASVGRFGKRPRKPCTRSRIGPTGASRKSSVSGNRVLALRAGGFWYEFGIGRRCQPVPPLASRSPPNDEGRGSSTTLPWEPVTVPGRFGAPSSLLAGSYERGLSPHNSGNGREGRLPCTRPTRDDDVRTFGPWSAPYLFRPLKTMVTFSQSGGHLPYGLFGGLRPNPTTLLTVRALTAPGTPAPLPMVAVSRSGSPAPDRTPSPARPSFGPGVLLPLPRRPSRAYGPVL